MRSQPSPRGIFLLVVGVIAVAFAATGGLDANLVGAASKGRGGKGGYGGDGGGGGKGYSGQCKSTCKKARKTCFFCRKQDLKAARNACNGLSKQELRVCRKNAKETYKALKADCKQRTSGCSSCCRQSYGSSCLETFAGTPGHGTFFRRYCSGYGQKKCRKEKPNCGVTDGASSGGAPQRSGATLLD